MSRFCAATTALLLALTTIAIAQEAWWEYYDSALSDIKTNNWSLAEQKLKASLKLQPNQGKKVRAYGARFIRYFPEYYLGVVAFNTGRYQEALELFLKVQNAGLITQGDAEYSELTTFSKQAMAKMNPSASQAPSAPTPEQQFATLMDQGGKAFAGRNYDQARNLANQALAMGINDQKANDLLRKIDIADNTDKLSAAIDKGDLALAQQLAPRVESLDPQSPEVVRLKQALAKQSDEEKLQQFSAALTRAERELASGNFARARDLAGQAKVIPGMDTQKARALLERIDDAENAALRLKSPPASTAQDQPGSQRFAAVMEEATHEFGLKNYAKARDLAAQAQALPGADLQKAAALSARIDLAESVTAFYSGQYKQSLQLLEQLATTRKDSATVYFYLACSNAALAFEQSRLAGGPAQKEQLLSKAREQFAQARKLDPLLKYDQQFISPRILQLYESQTK